MMISNDGLYAQGEVLPVITRHGTIHPAGGLDTHQHGWRIRHPQAVTELGQLVSIPPISGNLLGIYPYLGAWVGSQRKRPHCAFPWCGTALRLPDPPWLPDTKELPHDLHLLRYPQPWPYRCAACYPYCFRLCHQRGPSPHSVGWFAAGIPASGSGSYHWRTPSWIVCSIVFSMLPG